MSIDRNARTPHSAIPNHVLQRGQRRARLLTTSGLAVLMISALSLRPDAALAQMTVTPGGSVQLNATTATTATTNTNGANASSFDEIQLWNNGTPITATTDGVDSITGNGLTLEETGGTAAAISMTNAGNSSISSSSGIGLQMLGNGGGITYTDTSGNSVSGGTAGMSVSEIGSGAISLMVNGSVSGNTGDGIDSTAVDGNTQMTINGSVSGNAGINAIATGNGALVLTVNGTVTGNTGDGIDTTAVDGNTQVTINGYVSGNRGMDSVATGDGAIFLTISGSVYGNTGDAIDTSAVDGDTLVTVAGGIVKGIAGSIGINATATGSGNLDVVVMSNSIVGRLYSTGVELNQTGTGSESITNDGLIQGPGDIGPAIEIATTNAGTATITNNADGTITNTVGPNGLAIVSTVTTGADQIINAGSLTGEIALSNQSNSLINSGTWTVQDGTAVAAAFGASGLNTLSNSGTIYGYGTPTFTGIETIDNSGTITANGITFATGGAFAQTLINTGMIDLTGAGMANFIAGGAQTVTNTGTMEFAVAANFVGGGTSSFSNTGLIDMRSGATTDVMALNVTVANNTYTPGAAAYNFAGGAGSTLGLSASIGSASSSDTSVPANRLAINGTATGTTGILLSDIGGTAAYNPIGITLVAVNGSSTNAFYLQSMPGTSDVFEPTVGPLGAVKKGFWFYPLLQSSHATAVADGLTAPGSSEYRLYGLPDMEAFQLPLAVTGAEDIWYDTVLGWSDRQDELRKHWSGVYGPEDAYRSGQFNFWLKATGNWDSRSSSSSLNAYTPVPGVLPNFDTSFTQSTSSLQIGSDVGFNRFLADDDVLVLGLSVGYVNSALDFKMTDNEFKYSGVTVEATADYLNRGFFWDTALKTDLLQLGVHQSSLTYFGSTPQSIEADTWGVMSSAGYHIGLGANPASAYLEPLVTVAYTKSDFGNFTDIGTTTRFNASDSARGALGARFGGELSDGHSTIIDASLTGNYWDEFSNNTGVTLVTAGPALTLTDIRQKGYGEATGQVNIADKGSGVSGFVDAGAKFNGQFTSIELSAGIAYKW